MDTLHVWHNLRRTNVSNNYSRLLLNGNMYKGNIKQKDGLLSKQPKLKHQKHCFIAGHIV